MSDSVILFAAACPDGEKRVRSDHELKDIMHQVRSSTYPEHLKVETLWAATAENLLEGLNRCRPAILHFSGHGNADNQILLETEVGGTLALSPVDLGELLKCVGTDVRLVVLNACHSVKAASLITRDSSVKCAVGMEGRILDAMAIIFARNFYRAIAFGRSVGNAFRQAMWRLGLEKANAGSFATLHVAPGQDANEVCFPPDPPLEESGKTGKYSCCLETSFELDGPQQSQVPIDSEMILDWLRLVIAENLRTTPTRIDIRIQVTVEKRDRGRE